MSIQETSLPYSVDDLIKKLDEVYPEQSALLNWTTQEVWFKAGQRSVVNWLLELQRREQEQEE